MPLMRLFGYRSSVNSSKSSSKGEERAKEMTMMVPSISCGCRRRALAAAAAAFVSPTNFLRPASAASSASTSYNEDSINDPLSSSRGGLLQSQQRVPRPDEPNLYDIPSNLHPTHQPIPCLLRIIIHVLSSAVALLTTTKTATLKNWKQFTAMIHSTRYQLSSPSSTMSLIKNIASVLLRYLLISTLTKLILQEAFYPPSRVSTKYLVENNLLPSTLSCYQVVMPKTFLDVSVAHDENDSCAVVDEKKTILTNKKKEIIDSIGVHSIQYINPNYETTKKVKPPPQQQQDKSNPTKFDGIYLHHGFGASSLSWLPVLPSLVEQLNARLGVAHDAVGFGFTDRPPSSSHHRNHRSDDSFLEGYSTETNVGIGLELLESLLNRNDEDEEGDKWGGARAGGEMEGKNPKRNIAIFGHSMGAKAALLMALTCSKSNVPFHPSLVVLVAPALEGVSLPSSPRNKRKRRDLSENSSPTSIKTLRTTKLLSKLLQSLWITWREIFIDYPFRYFLRRLVGGSQDFWKKGLSLAWGDPNRLTDSDVLRFQWPSIGMGWEQGLLNFGRYSSSSSSSSSGPLLGDEELLSQVSSLPNTQVVILYGSKDKIVRFEGKISEKVKNMFPTVTLIRMGGLGHDPFEEDVDSFLIELKKAVVSH